MSNTGLSEFRSFSGHLHADGHSTQLTFSVRITQRGEVKFDFGDIILTHETAFIRTCWNSGRERVSHFSLSGMSDDGTEFKTDTLYFSSLQPEDHVENGSRMHPIGRCAQAKFNINISEHAQRPTLRIRVKGFECFGRLHSQCSLGKVVMAGAISITDHDTMTGHITVQSDSSPDDLTAWRKDADKLIEHIRRLMSFASATVLQAPITKFFSSNVLEVVVLSQSRQARSVMPTFHPYDLQPIFDVSVQSFFNPPIQAKNLFFAIEWFAMDATYSEIRLVNAMTALENIVVSNLEENDILIYQPRKFDAIRKILRRVIKDCVDEWQPEDEEKRNEAIKELNEKLIDLNRRSISRKIKALARIWSVPIDDINEKFQAAKKARDLIIHRGHYYTEGQEDQPALWEHVTVVREIVVRFLLTAIGYRGHYLSYLGGYHQAQFSPQEIQNTSNSVEHMPVPKEA